MATTFLEEIKKHKKDHPEYWGLKEEQFNVFTALRPISDEVYLHSRFISTMLDPNGLHNLGITPLKKFLKIIGCKKEYIEHISKETTTVTPNSKNWTEECEIDILIENNDKDKKFAIIIENKIFASDSNHIEEKDESGNTPKDNEGQLARYYRYITTGITPNEKRKRTITYNSDQVEIYYLTLDQHKPSKISLGSQLSVKGDKKEGTKEVNLIDYKKEICEWIEALLAYATESNLQGAITQYQQVVKKLVGDIELNKEISNLVSKYYKDVKNIKLEEVLKGEKDVNHLIDVKWHAIDSFLNNLGNELQQLKIEVEGRSSHLAITDLLYHPNKHTPIYFRIKQNGIVWTLQADDRSRERGFFLGIDNTTMPNIEKCSEIEELNLKENEYTNTEGWHAIKYLSESALKVNEKTENYPLLNLWDFTKGDTFNLLNEDKRKEIAHQYAAFVEQELNKIN